MGGILGIVSFRDDENIKIEQCVLKKMSSVLVHRGPDEKLWCSENVAFVSRTFFKNRRDKNKGLTNEGGSIYAIMDGNIYQKAKWIKFLEARGHRFSTSDDSELLIHLYEELGETVASKIIGEFAFAIWDSSCKKLLLARDPVGTKPLFYFYQGKKLVFASEIKSILENPDYDKRVDLKSIILFFNFTYVHWPDTFFDNIKQVSPGCILIIEEGHITEKPYWDFGYQPIKFSIEKYSTYIYEIVKKAIYRQIEGASSFGALLSGGIDTTILLGLLSQLSDSPIKVFTAGFEEEAYNELPFSRIVAKRYGAKQYEVIVKSCDVKKLLPKIIWHTDTPFFDSSAIPTYFVLKLAKEHVNLVLTGDGPDQLLAGSNAYADWKRRNTFFRPFPERIRATLLHWLFANLNVNELKHDLTEKIKMHLKFESYPFWKRFLLKKSVLTLDLQGLLFSKQLREVLSDPIENLHYFFENKGEWGSLGQMLYYDQKHYLHDDLIVKVDRMAAANSLEVRFPFLDVFLLDFIALIPNDLKMKGMWKPNKKYILKKTFKDILPEKIISRRKQGFGIPFDIWLKKELKQFVYQILLDQRAKNRGYFNTSILEKILNNYYSDKNPYLGGSIWALTMLEIWHQVFID